MTRPVPHDIEAERATLGSILLDPDRYSDVATLVGPTDFFDTNHQQVCRAMVELHTGDQPIDYQLILSAIGDDIENAAGILGKIVDAVPHPGRAKHYAGIVKDRSVRRQLLRLGDNVVESAMNGQPVAETIADAECTLHDLGQTITVSASGIDYTDASDLGGGDAMEFIWQGWAAREHIMLIVGLWKAGKSTMLGHVLHATAHGGDVGGRIEPCKAIVVAEESSTLWAQRRDSAEIDNNVQFVIRPFKAKPSIVEWQQFVGGLARDVAENAVGLVIIDTLQAVSPVKDENDAAETMRAMLPLHAVTEAGAAVVLAHHPRKGDGNEGQAARGSGALAGFVDVICELRRFDPERSEDRRRVLKGYSRFDETPAEVVIELCDDGYRTVGTKADAGQNDRFQVIEDILRASPASDAAAVRADWPEDTIPKPALRTLRRDLGNGVHKGLWAGSGAGHKGEPVRYTIPD